MTSASSVATNLKQEVLQTFLSCDGNKSFGEFGAVYWSQSFGHQLVVTQKRKLAYYSGPAARWLPIDFHKEIHLQSGFFSPPRASAGEDAHYLKARVALCQFWDTI